MANHIKWGSGDRPVTREEAAEAYRAQRDRSPKDKLAKVLLPTSVWRRLIEQKVCY